MNDNELKIAINAQDNASAVIEKAQGKISGSAQSIASGMQKAAIGLGVVGAGLTAYSKSAVDTVVDLASSSKALARETGSTQVEASKLNAVMTRLGIDAGETSAMFGIFSKQIVNSRDKSSDAALKAKDLQNQIAGNKIQVKQLTDEMKKNGDASGDLKNKIEALGIKTQELTQNLKDTANPLDQLHISTLAANGSARDFNDILFDVADKFKSLPDGAEKTALAMQLFGRSGKDMIKVLDQGSQGIKDLEAQADKLGLTLTQQNIGAINDYIKSQKDLKATSDSIKIAVGTLTAPVLAKFNEQLNNTILKLVGTDSPARGLIANILAFGGPIAGAAAGFVSFGSNLITMWPAISVGFNAMMNGITIGFQTFKLITIPSAIASLQAFRASAAFPFVMGGLVIAGILADLALVTDAVNKVRGAITAVNDAAKAAENLGPEDQMRALQQQATAARKAGDTKKVTQLSNAIAALGGGRATGGAVDAGQTYLIGEAGPESFTPNTQGRVNPNVPAGAGDTKNILSGNFYFSTAESVDAFFKRLDKTQRLGQMGMA